MLQRTLFGLAVAAVTSWAGAAYAQETGTLKVRFVYGGPPPEPEKLDPNKDREFCGKFPLINESLVVNQENSGIQNVILYVYTGRGGSKLPEMEPQNKTHELANDQCRFEPHVLIAQKGDTINVTNPDEVGHNANFNFFNNPPVNFTIPPKGEKAVELAETEPAPIPVDCNIHPWMRAWVLVVDHPFAAVSDADGNLVIEGLPAGEELVFRLSHEGAKGAIRSVKVNGKDERLSRNQWEIEIKPGMNDLGEVEIAAEAFGK